MHRLVNFGKNLFLLSIPSLAILAVVLELIFRFVIPAAEKPIAYFDEEHALLRSDEKRRTTGTYTIGKYARIRSRWRTNNYGWNSQIDYSANNPGKRLVCIIGDSFVRALQVDLHKNISFLLRAHLSPEYEVYSFGHDGAPLSQYLHMSRYVNRYFNPDILIFLLIRNDFDQSVTDLVSIPYFLQLRLTDNEVVEIQPTTRPLYQFLTYSAIFRYLFSNLELSQLYFRLVQKPDNFNANVNVFALANARTLIHRGTNYLMTRIEEENKEKRVIFVMNAPVEKIHQGRLENNWMNAMVREICARHRLECIDLTEPFYENYRKEGKRFTFEVDGHWNEHGHLVASDVLHRYLMSPRRHRPRGAGGEGF